MSISALNRAARLLPVSRLSSSQRLILLALCYHHHAKNDACHPAIPTIAAIAGLSTRRARMALRDLEAQGFVETKFRFAGGRQTSNTYRLFPPQTGLVSGGQKKPRTRTAVGRTAWSGNKGTNSSKEVEPELKTIPPGQDIGNDPEASNGP